MDQLEPEVRQIEQRPERVHELSDHDLVAEVLCKDRKATAELVSRCADLIYGYVRRRLAPRADLVDDLVQDVFFAAWENLNQYRGDSTLRNWMLGIARHKVEDHYRLRLKAIQIEEEIDGPGGEEPVGTHDLEEAISKGQTDRAAREILASLPESCSVILQWRYWECRNLRDIAMCTGKTEKAVERLLARARSQFRKRWNERQSTSRR
jgi:RNA polymerase sigma-70 factor (ECF subfamily)